MQMPRIEDNKVLFPELSYEVCGLCFKVHNCLGKFRNEKQYADALEELLKENKISYEREKALPQSFKGEEKNRNIPDFVIKNTIVVDLKAKPIVTRDDYLQMKRYLVSCKKKLGLIVNFHQNYIRPKRVLNNEY